MKRKVATILVSLVGFAALAAIPATSAQAWTTCPAGTSSSGAYCTCPAGTSVGAYCTCPAGTSVGAYCTCPAGTTVGEYCTCPAGTSDGAYCTVSVLPEGPPTITKVELWGLEDKWRGPALKFRIKKGINGTPGIVGYTCTLPKGLYFYKDETGHGTIASGGNTKTTTTRTLTVKTSKAVPTVFAYVRNHAIWASKSLLEKIKKGETTSLTFNFTVTDAAGLVTKLSYTVKPLH